MCGLFGCAGPGIGTLEMSRLRELAYISGLRGGDGSGIVQGLATKRVLRHTLEKTRNDITYFMWYHGNHSDGNDKILHDYSCNFILGHVRAATRGDVSDDNAHPFDTGRFISAHNGTLHDKKYHDNEKTDSEMMFIDVEKRGLQPVLRDLDAGSAFSISSFDKQNKELIFATNGKRPLVYCYLSKRRVFFWASERRQLEFALQGVEKSEIYKFTDDMIYTFHPEDVEAGRPPKWTTRRIKPVQEPFRVPAGRTVRPPLVTETRTLHQNQNIIRIADKGRIPLATQIKDKISEHDRAHKANLLIRKCIHCSRDMDLLAQYEGVEVDVGLYSCRDCDDLMQELQTQGHYKIATSTRH